MTKVTFSDPAFQGHIIPVHMLAGLNQIGSSTAGEIVFSSSFDAATTLRAVGNGITRDGQGHVTGGTLTEIEFRVNGLVVERLTDFGTLAAVDAATAFTGGSVTGYDRMIALLAGRTVVTGSQAADWMDAGGGNDLVTGGAGDDRLSKFLPGNLRFDGGEGSDTLNLGAENGLIYPTPFLRQFVVDLGAGTALSPYGGTFTLISVENVIGTSQADRITGTDAANVTGDGSFDAGADIIATLGGDDTVKLLGRVTGVQADGGSGVDTLYVSTFGGPAGLHVLDLMDAGQNRGFFATNSLTGFEYVVLSADTTGMRLRFLGDDGTNRVEAGTADDVLLGRGGVDILFGGAGDDTIQGGAGGDYQIGGEGDDLYVVDHAGDTVQEADGQGYDRIRASVSHAMWAYVEDMTLTGHADIEGRGNNQANHLTGNAGDNHLIGGGGADSLTGGRGADVFVWENGFDTGIGKGQRDVITDFAPGDRIDLRCDANTLLDGVQPFHRDAGGSFRAGEYRVAALGGHVVINLSLDGGLDAQIEVVGVTSLTDGDFLL